MSILQNLFFDWLKTGQDTWMAMFTRECLVIFLSIFIILILWYLVPIILRWFQIKINHRFVYNSVRNVQNLKEKRKEIQFEIFKRTRWARQHYHNFRMTWEKARLPNEDKAVIPIRLKEFFGPELVIDGAVNRRIAETLPGIFVTLGIFGTFLGLVLGLKGVRIEGIVNLKQGVGQLLSGLSLAFLTSLYGIAFSVIFSITYRFFVRRLEKALYSLDELFTILFPYHSYERYFRKHLELQADVKQGLQTLATDVAMKIRDTIAPAMDEVLVKHLVPIMQGLQTQVRKSTEDSKQQQIKILGNLGEQIERMSAVITDHFESSQKKQSEAMEEVLNQYVEKMNETFISQFQDMGRIIEETTKAQSEIKVQLVQFTEQLQNQFTVQSELIKKTSRAGQILSESLESLEGISRELKSSASDIASAAVLLKEAAARAMEGQEALQQSMEGQIRAMSTTREELEKAWNTITINTDSTIQLVRQVIKELAEGVGEQLNNALTAFDSAVAEVVERFSGTLSETNQTIEELPSVLIKMGENFKGIRGDIETQREILNELKDITKGIVATNIERATTASNELSNTAKSITISTQELKHWFNGALENIKSGGGNLERKTKESFDELRDLIDVSLKSLNDSMKVFEKIGDGDGKGYEELLNGIKIIIARMNDLNKDIRNDFFEELKSIKESTIRIVEAADELRSLLSKPEDRKGIFGRIMNR